MKLKAFIGIAAHKPIFLNNEIPYHHIICVGAEKNKGTFSNAEYYDNDISDNISQKNNIYNELTAHYYMWKKDIDAEYIGLCHYRRYFNFKLKYRYPRKGVIRGVSGNKTNEIEKCLGQYDLYWAAQEPGTRPECSSIYESNIYNNNTTNKSSVDILIECVDETVPEYGLYAREYFGQNSEHMFNMFVMKKELFNQYSEWLFKVLNRYEARLNGLGYKMDRSCGFAGEHLLNIWGTYQIRERGIRAVSLQTIMVYCPESHVGMKSFISGIVKLVFSFFFPYGSGRRDRIKWKYFMK